jgi:hypothetical protein
MVLNVGIWCLSKGTFYKLRVFFKASMFKNLRQTSSVSEWHLLDSFPIVTLLSC